MQMTDAILLGLVEGITEFLPVSSTAHLLLTERALGLAHTPSTEAFTIAVQCGALVAALVLYAPLLMQHRRMWLLLLVAFAPTAVIGLLVHDFVTQHLFSSLGTIAAALGIGGVALIVFEQWQQTRKIADPTTLHTLTIRQAVLIGICQSLAVVPGVSRSAATIVGGQLLGLSRGAIVEFSFLLAIPTLGAATTLDLWKARHDLVSHDLVLIAVGSLVAGITAWIVMRWLLRYVQRHTFTIFGIYRILLSLGIVAVLLRA